MKQAFSAVILVLCLCLSGCSGSMTVEPSKLSNDPMFDMELTTTNYLAYDLIVSNKTKKDVEILWDKTYYIDETNSTNGGFMYGNEVYYEDQEKPKKPSVVFPNDRITKTIYPSVLAYWSRSWKYGYLPAGKSGVYLTLLANGEEVKKRLYVNITY